MESKWHVGFLGLCCIVSEEFDDNNLNILTLIIALYYGQIWFGASGSEKW